MFGRKKDLNEELTEQATSEARPGAKNRPTPKRRDQEAANKRPLIVTDRKAARTVDKTARREQLAKQRAGMMAGKEEFLPPRDKGPRRRFIRDSVDARWNVGEFMLPVMLVALALSFFASSTGNPTTFLISFVLIYGLIIVAVIDALLMWRRIKRRVEERFGQAEKGDGFYSITRAFQMRRLRMPKPLIARGDKP